MKKPELLAPAGNLENLKVAFTYGADAVYFSGKKYGLRAKADNFTLDEIKQAAAFAHNIGKKVYVTLNIIPHNEDLAELPEYIKELENAKIDGIIASDPGIISLVKENSPGIPIHLSTQANNTNYKSACFWYNSGIKRITLARELSIEEIKEIVKKTPDKLELEVFVHGSVCIAYSGRCMLSLYMINRDANMGNCAQACRWNYSLQEKKRPGEYFDVFEDDEGSYIFNSRDLCLIEHIPELINAGVTSFKIEGRMKSSYYVAVATKAYRTVIDNYLKNPENYKPDPLIYKELEKVNHRKYSTGFFNAQPGNNSYIYDSTGYVFPYLYLGLVLDYDPETQLATVYQQNKITAGDEIEVIGPDRDFFVQTVGEMFNENNEPVTAAPSAQCKTKIKMASPVKPLDMLRIVLKKPDLQP